MAPAVDSVPYTCSVKPGPFARCDRVQTAPGETVTVQVGESGTVTRGDFRAVSRYTGETLGTVRDVTPSSGSVVIWHNDTGSSVLVDVLAASPDDGRIDGLVSAGP
ncbi:hypothetical protein ACIPRL_35145 [Streptomyces sp. NPDC090085]|uniref:hypothetical protein n=1 Tax=unclassified Streptomyces TaxID=2593676 RepID=UPI00343191E3